MNAIETVSDPLESFMDQPIYVDTRPFIVAAVLVALYVLASELPAAQRYLNLKSMARDHKPTR